jgi:hypothetical protein
LRNTEGETNEVQHISKEESGDRCLGVARNIARNSYKAERVGSELKELLGNPAYSRKAREIGSRVRSERGAAHAVDLILDRLNERRSDRFRLRTVA